MTTAAEPTLAPRRSSSSLLLTLLLMAAASLLVVGWVVSTYNALVRGDQDVRARWAQVENAYQRRADLVPNLVATVKGAAGFEARTLESVTEARARVAALPPEALQRVLEDPKLFARYHEVQQALGQSVGRLLAVAEAYPTLGATAAFRDLQSQLEGTENRITVERMRFNEAVRDFNVLRRRFPAVLVAGSFGERFAEKPLFAAQPGAQVPPAVRFE